jgi:hypothetical protein
MNIHKEKKMDDAKIHILMLLPIYILWKLGPYDTMNIHLLPYTIGLEKIGQSGRRRRRRRRSKQAVLLPSKQAVPNADLMSFMLMPALF